MSNKFWWSYFLETLGAGMVIYGSASAWGKKGLNIINGVEDWFGAVTLFLGLVTLYNLYLAKERERHSLLAIGIIVPLTAALSFFTMPVRYHIGGFNLATSIQLAFPGIYIAFVGGLIILVAGLGLYLKKGQSK
ncbi:MAG: hypothetical protein JG781_486 [Peptococcaceae bacterium]|jgi:bacteriorhodopsin|nr:hypothetical protein [Peptococcaceae bacterium]